MLAAQALRVIRPDRVVVMLEETRSVVELQLSQPLSKEQLARARSLLSPLSPVPVMEKPGEFHAGVFYGSSVEDMRFRIAARPRVPYKKR